MKEERRAQKKLANRAETDAPIENGLDTGIDTDIETGMVGENETGNLPVEPGQQN